MSLIRINRAPLTSNLFPKSLFADDLFNSNWPLPLLDWGNGSDNGKEWIPAANIKEGEKEYAVELSVPGYTKKNIHVEVDSNRVLRVTGEREEESKEETEDYTRKEFSYGSFTRSFQLPETVDQDKIGANCKDGVLTLGLPKKKTALKSEKVKEISIA